jgi:hypothetical protein
VTGINIFVYSDESGVFDKYHEDYFIYGGVLFLSPDDRDTWSRKFIAAENNVRLSEKIAAPAEVKASNISNRSKLKLYSALANAERFGAVISQKRLNDHLFSDKKTKQRYLDWAFKMAVKRKLEHLISTGLIDPAEVEYINFFADEHTTATNGRYELRESLEQELKFGTYNWNWSTYHEPLFPTLKNVNLEYCNSAKKTLIRAADIVANRLYYLARTNTGIIPEEEKLSVYYHP